MESSVKGTLELEFKTMKEAHVWGKVERTQQADEIEYTGALRWRTAGSGQSGYIFPKRNVQKQSDERDTDSALYSKCVKTYSQKHISVNTSLVSLLL